MQVEISTQVNPTCVRTVKLICKDFKMKVERPKACDKVPRSDECNLCYSAHNCSNELNNTIVSYRPVAKW
jgi:hypothetical protein